MKIPTCSTLQGNLFLRRYSIMTVSEVKIHVTVNEQNQRSTKTDEAAAH